MIASRWIEWASTGVEVAGVAIIVVGAIVAALWALHRAWRDGRKAGYVSYRHGLGRSILLGLELLVAADIIRTVAEIPSLSRVVVLAAIVAIRTFLSWSLEVELEGRWPWRREQAEDSERAQGRGPNGNSSRRGEAHG